MASDQSKTTLRNCVYTVSQGEMLALLRKSRADAMQEAAEICERQQREFLSEQYAINQPMSSFGERFACGQCAKAIREAAGLEDPHAR